MTADQFVNLLAAVTLIVMMLTTGMAVRFSDVYQVCRNVDLLARAAIANYIIVPAAAVALLHLFHAGPMIAAGVLVVAACPGAPYGPPLTALARGQVVCSVGIMVFLAGSSAIVAPLLLRFLLPLLARDTALRIDVLRIVGTLFGTQLLPLTAGIWIGDRHPQLASKLKPFAGVLSLALNIVLVILIFVLQFQMLAEIRPRGYFGMSSLLLATIAAGWIASAHMKTSAKTLVLATSVRNVGVALVITTSCFAGTPAISSATAYGLFQTLVMACIALLWGRGSENVPLVEKTAA